MRWAAHACIYNSKIPQYAGIRTNVNMHANAHAPARYHLYTQNRHACTRTHYAYEQTYRFENNFSDIWIPHALLDLLQIFISSKRTQGHECLMKCSDAFNHKRKPCKVTLATRRIPSDIHVRTLTLTPTHSHTQTYTHAYTLVVFQIRTNQLSMLIRPDINYYVYAQGQ